MCIRGKKETDIYYICLMAKKSEKNIPGNILHTKAGHLQQQWGTHQEICSRPKEEARKAPAVK